MGLEVGVMNMTAPQEHEPFILEGCMIQSKACDTVGIRATRPRTTDVGLEALRDPKAFPNILIPCRSNSNSHYCILPPRAFICSLANDMMEVLVSRNGRLAMQHVEV